jgi:hypothetical protein
MRQRTWYLSLVALLLCFALSGVVHVSAQALPFTPTPEPTDTPTPTATATRTATPTVTPTPTTAVLPDAPPIGTEHATQQPQATGQVVVIVATPTEAPKPTKTPLPAGYGRDHCDPNHTLSQPCALATETDNADLNFNSSPVDVFSFLLKAGRHYRIEASSAMGLDPSLEVFLAGAIDTPLLANDDERIGSTTAVVTVSVELDSWYLVRVSNKAPDNPEGKTYRVSARSVATANTEATPEPSNPDDLIGNAYDEHHAARLAWGVPYDLTMQCPDPHGCWDGRHIFALIPVKKDVPLIAITYDLGLGVDTILTVYKPDPHQNEASSGKVKGWSVIASNDDIVSGWTLRSQVLIQPDWNGSALLVIAPSERGDTPVLPSEGRQGRFRFITGSPALPTVKDVIDAQKDLPPPPPTPTARPTSQADVPAVSTVEAQDSREVIKESCPTGVAVVGESTGFYAAAPPADGDRLASYPQGAAVKLLGECYRGWVKVQPMDSVTPGWMWAPTLRPEALDAQDIETSPGEGQAPYTGTPSSGNQTPHTGTPSSGNQTPHTGTPSSGNQAPAVTPVVLERRLEIIPLSPQAPPAQSPMQPEGRTYTIQVCYAEQKGCGQFLRTLRVELILASTGEVKVSGATNEQGRVTLTTSVPKGTQLVLRIPNLGLSYTLGEQSDISIRVGG